MVTIKVPRSKGKINGKVVSKRRYVFYFVNTLMENALAPAPKNEIHALSERITDLVLRKAGKMEIVKVTVSPKYCGYAKIAGKTIGVYDFTLTIHVKDKVISVYEIRRNFNDRLFDIKFRAPNAIKQYNENYADFVDIADFVVNHNSVMPRFDMPNDFADIANYVVDYAKAYGKIKPVRVSDYHVITNFAKFIELLDMFHIVFLSMETTKLVSTKFTFLAYKYLKESGYFALSRGDIE